MNGYVVLSMAAVLGGKGFEGWRGVFYVGDFGMMGKERVELGECGNLLV